MFGYYKYRKVFELRNVSAKIRVFVFSGEFSVRASEYQEHWRSISDLKILNIWKGVCLVHENFYCSLVCSWYVPNFRMGDILPTKIFK